MWLVVHSGPDSPGTWPGKRERRFGNVNSSDEKYNRRTRLEFPSKELFGVKLLRGMLAHAVEFRTACEVEMLRGYLHRMIGFFN